jgi:3-deoxy-D-manno-octulosonic-acid transferase
VVPLYLHYRVRQEKEDPARLGERYGRASQSRPPGRLLWLHGASVGETLSALPFIEHVLDTQPALWVLVTSGTRTSAELLSRRLPARAIHQYLPLDIPAYTNRFLDHWRPDAAIWLESELWPVMLETMRRRALPAARLNARLTEKSAIGWQRFAGWFRHLLSTFSLTLPISAADGQRLQNAGAPGLAMAGNLKFTAPAPMADSGELAELKTHIGTRPVWLFANSHPGEEEMARRIHATLARRWPDLLTVIIPRHPARADDVEMMLGGAVPRRSRGEWPQSGQAFYLGDTMGEMGLFYRAIPIAVVGGSFTPKGGHNPLEPAQCSAAPLIGPDTSKCADIVEELKTAGALIQLPDETALTEELATLLAQPDVRRLRAKAAHAASQRQDEIMASTLAALAPLLQKLDIKP